MNLQVWDRPLAWPAAWHLGGSRDVQPAPGSASHTPSQSERLQTNTPLPRPADVQTIATEAHVRQALELFKTSTMDAVKSGLMDVAVFTDEQRWVLAALAAFARAHTVTLCVQAAHRPACQRMRLPGDATEDRSAGVAGQRAPGRRSQGGASLLQAGHGRRAPQRARCCRAARPAAACRQEVHRVEEQIKRRVAIGSFVSERKLVDELVRWASNACLLPGLAF